MRIRATSRIAQEVDMQEQAASHIKHRIAQQVEDFIEDNNLIQTQVEPPGDIIMSITLDIEGLRAPATLAGPFTRSELHYHAKGNPGALGALAAVSGNIEAHIYIRKWGLRGSDLYVIWSDCCGKNVDKFKKVLASELVPELIQSYRDSGRGRTVEWEELN